MAVHLHHVNIRAEDIEATVAFYVEAVGLTNGDRPDFGFPGAWLYDGDKPAVHLTLATEPAAAAAPAVDHVAFAYDALDEALKRLDQAEPALHEAEARSGNRNPPVLPEGPERSHRRIAGALSASQNPRTAASRLRAGSRRPGPALSDQETLPGRRIVVHQMTDAPGLRFGFRHPRPLRRRRRNRHCR